MTVVLSKDRFLELARRYTSGEDINLLAKEYGVGKKAIWSRLKRSGINAHREMKRLSYEQIDELIRLYRNGERNRDLCKKYGIGQGRIVYLLVKNGVYRSGWSKRRGECHVCHQKLTEENFDPMFKAMNNYTCRRCGREKRLRRNRAVRLHVLEYYGNRCVCCNEATTEFLTIDHINGGGLKHKLSVKKRGTGYYRWIKNNGYPTDLRVLCSNCNHSLGAYGYCPHQSEQRIIRTDT